MLPILYSFRRCPYAIRARLALLVGSRRVELREVVLRAKPDALLAASPKGTVPVLVLPDGRVIDQSLAIMHWALGDAPADALIAANDGPFKHHLDRYKYPDRHGDDPTDHRQAALALLAPLERRLADSGQLDGIHPGLTDWAIFPFVRQFAAVDPGWFATRPLPAVRRWLAGHLASALFARAMVRYAPWSPEDRPRLFPSEEQA